MPRVITVLLAAAALSSGVAYAASTGVSSAKLTGWHSTTTVPCVPATLTASADADSWIDSASTAANHGTATTLSVQSLLLLGNHRTLVRFPLPATPYACSVTLAKLRLYSSTASPLGRTLEAFQAGSAWTEAGVTWANQPSTTGSAATTTSGAGWREWTVTTEVAAMYSGTNHGFLIRDQAESAAVVAEQLVNSRENGSNPPELVVTFG